MRKYTNTNIQIHKYTISQSAKNTYFWKGDCSRMSSESRTVVQGLVMIIMILMMQIAILMMIMMKIMILMMIMRKPEDQTEGFALPPSSLVPANQPTVLGSDQKSSSI